MNRQVIQLSPSVEWKAITVWQPYATLIALRLKRFETRGWQTKYRGPLAIHAAKKIDYEACEHELIKSALAKHGYTVDNLPTGAIIAYSELKDCHEIGKVDTWDRIADYKWTDGCIWGDEFEFGWYEEGRFAWEIVDVRQIEPIPAKGQQRLWNWTPAV